MEESRFKKVKIMYAMDILISESDIQNVKSEVWNVPYVGCNKLEICSWPVSSVLEIIYILFSAKLIPVYVPLNT